MKQLKNYASHLEPTKTDRETWAVRRSFHNLSYKKKKVILADMILWATKMDEKIDQEYEKEHHLEKL